MLEEQKWRQIILIAEDDDDQYDLTSSALGEWRATNRLRRVVNGEELLDYLLRRGEYENARLYPKPCLILLDLNMPRKDGRQALRELKADPALRATPVVVLTVSRDEEDVRLMYSLGASSFITKPLSYERLEQCMKALERYWFDVTRLPQTD